MKSMALIRFGSAAIALFTVLTFSSPLQAMQLGGVASPSLSRLKAYANPAVIGFGESSFELAAHSQKESFSLPPTVDVSVDIFTIHLRTESFFFQATNFSITDPFSTNGIRGDQYSAGWRNKEWSLALSSRMEDDGFQVMTNSLFGLGWRMSENIYYGYLGDSNDKGDMAHSFAFAYVVEKAFRMEASTRNQTFAIGSSSSAQVYNMEGQWSNYVLGYQTSYESDSFMPGLKQDSKTYLAYEPDGSGLSFYYEMGDRPGDPAFVKSNVLGLGISF